MAADFANLQLEYFHSSRRFNLGNIFILPALKSPAAMKISYLLNSQNKLPWVGKRNNSLSITPPIAPHSSTLST